MAGGEYPGMPFNQQMNFPCEMTLRTTANGPRIFRNPAREIQSLRTKTHTLGELSVKPGENPLSAIHAELLDIETEIEPGAATECGLEIRGERLVYSAKNQTLAFLGKTAPVPLIEGRLHLRVLIDRTTVEAFCPGRPRSHVVLLGTEARRPTTRPFRHRRHGQGPFVAGA